MKTTLFNLIVKSQYYLERLKTKYFNAVNDNENNNYFQLSPIKDFKDNNRYTEALEWALKNRKEKDIKNVALTGPYGAGKSSILKTFQENNIDPSLKFLNISLATFKEEDSPSNADDVKDQTIEKLRQIEISILQQIFYHEEDEKIPDSRFKKIKISSRKELTLKSVSILVAIISIFWLFSDRFELKNFPNFFSSIIFFEKISLLLILGFISYLYFIFWKGEGKVKQNFVPLSLIFINLCVVIVFGFQYIINIQNFISTIAPLKNIKIILINLSIIYLLTFGYLLIKEVLAFINKVTVNKFTVKDVEIEIGSKHQKSVMNQHLDEILYFFSVRPYNVVIIEDLDRFKQTEIFTKLREINLILNQSEKTKDKNIVFVYAVRDEMFQDKDRTKFFDFIVPVIPTINSSNSSQILLSKNIENKYGLSEGFIENISFIIDDMRLLHNICNEFYLYKKLLSDRLDPEKLFSIITYKNIIPNDFVSLSNNEGTLYKLLNSKRNFITQINDNIDLEISVLRQDLESLEKNYSKNIIDVRKIYILKLIEKLEYFETFIIDDKVVSIDDLAKEENFAYLINNDVLYNKFYAYNNYLHTQSSKINILFTDLEKEVEPNKNYSKIEQEIEDINNDMINATKIMIKDLENQKNYNRVKRLKDLLNDSKFSIDDLEAGVEKGKNDFLLTLIRNGYIGEDYIEYISIFHEGSISRNDHSFYINIQNRIVQDFNYKLNRTENLINKISLIDFRTEYVFNYNLLDFLLVNQTQYQTQLNNIIDKIKDESEESIEFVISCYTNLEYTREFTIILADQWINFWTIISNNKTIERSTLDEIFLSIIKFANLDNLKKISSNNTLKQKIYTNSDFLNIIDDHERIRNIITTLNIYFESIDFKNSPKQLSDFVYENWYYEINIPNLESIMRFYGEFNGVDFAKSNYKSILNSGCEELLNHINENMSLYISDVYLMLNTNTEEEEDSYIELLNNENIDEDEIKYIIQKVNTKITDVVSIKKNDDQLKLLKNNKLKAVWENVLFFVDSKQTQKDSIVNFINDIENAKSLNKQRVKIIKDEKENYVYSNSYKQILEFENIDDENYNLIVESSPWLFDNFNWEMLQSNKIKILIQNSKINPTLKSFEGLREYHKDLLIELVEKYPNQIMKIIETLEVDVEDLELILKSSKLSDTIKNKFLNKISDAEISDSKNVIYIAAIKAQNNTFSISRNLLISIFTNNLSDYNDRIKIFNNNSTDLTNEEIENFLNHLPNDFPDINNKDKKAWIDSSEDNLALLKILEKKGYISSFREERNGWRVSHRRR
ncbi:hypothetical protein [Chryseobacterium sp.]|uniref:YobI family P-loop NTPase n=1 Tax=Chryseobacterium sp. TaxID=1871047 RepID=UPI0023F31E56|nr:hypothetical protein [Chryseobacterium sp.]